MNREQRRAAGHRTPNQQRMVSALDAVAVPGDRMPGGCDGCEAYQTLAADAPGVFRLTVHHDDWCPELQGRTR